MKDYSAPRNSAEYVPLGKTPEDALRHAAFVTLHCEAVSWHGPGNFVKRAKAFRIDVKKIVDEIAPVEQPAPAKAAAKGKK